jgi:hypothetical protein
MELKDDTGQNYVHRHDHGIDGYHSTESEKAASEVSFGILRRPGSMRTNICGY